MIFSFKQAVIFAQASTALSIGARQVSDDSVADTGVTNSTAPLDLSIALAASQPVQPIEDGLASWDEPENTVTAPITLVALDSAQINATIDAGALDDITSTTPQKRGVDVFKRAASTNCGIGGTPYTAQNMYNNADRRLYGSPSPQVGNYGLVNSADLEGAISDPSYITYTVLASSKVAPMDASKPITGYVDRCIAYCDSKKDCKSFNLYYEFDNPSYDPTAPASTSVNPTFDVRCAVYSAPFKKGAGFRINPGQWTSNCVGPQGGDRPFLGSRPATTPATAPVPRFIKNAISLVYSKSVVNCPTGFDTIGSPTDDRDARYMGGNNPISQSNILQLFVTDSYSAEDCAARCRAEAGCGFFNIFGVSPGDNPNGPNNGLKYFGPDKPQLPVGTNVPNGVPTSFNCNLFRLNEPVETRTSYGQFSSSGFNYVVNSLSCGLPGNEVDGAATPGCTGTTCVIV